MKSFLVLTYIHTNKSEATHSETPLKTRLPQHAQKACQRSLNSNADHVRATKVSQRSFMIHKLFSLKSGQTQCESCNLRFSTFLLLTKADSLLNRPHQLVPQCFKGPIWRQIQPVETRVTLRQLALLPAFLNRKPPRPI